MCFFYQPQWCNLHHLRNVRTYYTKIKPKMGMRRTRVRIVLAVKSRHFHYRKLRFIITNKTVESRERFNIQRWL